MKRPKIELDKTPVDWILEIMTTVLALCLIGLPLYYFNVLPEKIPSHFNFQGEPDAYSSKGSIWFMPVLGFGCYVLLALLNRFPHWFNYPVQITEQNAKKQYQIMTLMMRILNLIVVLTFTHITYQTISVATGISYGLGIWFLPVLFTFVFGLLGWSVVVSMRNQ